MSRCTTRLIDRQRGQGESGLLSHRQPEARRLSAELVAGRKLRARRTVSAPRMMNLATSNPERRAGWDSAAWPPTTDVIRSISADVRVSRNSRPFRRRPRDFGAAPWSTGRPTPSCATTGAGTEDQTLGAGRRGGAIEKALVSSSQDQPRSRCIGTSTMSNVYVETPYETVTVTPRTSRRLA